MDFSDLAFELQWEQCFSLVNNWQKAMIDQIENVHRKHTSQIQRYKTRAEKSFHRDKDRFILDLNEYFQHDSIQSNEIHSFKKKLNQLKENLIHRPLPLNIQIQSSSLENPILIRSFFTKNSFDERTILARYPIPTKSIRSMVTSNNQIVLIDQQSMVFIYEYVFGLIDRMNLLDYTNEHFQAICWSRMARKFLLLFEHSLWSWEEFGLKKLAHVARKSHRLSHLICLNNSLFLIYDQGEFIDRWKIEPEWKLDKRWFRRQPIEQVKSIAANDQHLLFYTNQSIQFYSEDFLLQYTIDHDHLFSDFVYLVNYRTWLMIDQQTHVIYFFHVDERRIQAIDQIFVQKMNVMNDYVVWINNDLNQLEIISIE